VPQPSRSLLPLREPEKFLKTVLIIVWWLLAFAAQARHDLAGTDANGNTLFGDLDGNGANEQTANDVYDLEDRLTTSARTGKTVTLAYDGDGNRTLKDVNVSGTVTTTRYVVDDRTPSGYAQVLEEWQSVNNAAWTLARKYTYGLSRIRQERLTGTPGTDYYGYDGHGNVALLVDGATGAEGNTYSYDAYGVLVAQGGNTPNHYQYSGEQWDSDLGMYYLRARYMNPQSGRFWTMDTFEGNSSTPLSLHKYLYAHNDPVNGVDPSGHEFSLTSLNTSIATGLRITTQVGVRAGRALTKARRFFWDSRTYNAVSKAYWKANGPANGRSLHHWLIPQKMARIPQGLRNAGFNLMELPKVLPGNLGLNQWMGFAANWGGYRAVFAFTIENGIRILIPLSIYEAATIGNNSNQNNGEPVVEQFELKPSDWDDDRGFEDLRELTADDEEPVLGPGQLIQPQP